MLKALLRQTTDVPIPRSPKCPSCHSSNTPHAMPSRGICICLSVCWKLYSLKTSRRTPIRCFLRSLRFHVICSERLFLATLSLRQEHPRFSLLPSYPDLLFYRAMITCTWTNPPQSHLWLYPSPYLRVCIFICLFFSLLPDCGLWRRGLSPFQYFTSSNIKQLLANSNVTVERRALVWRFCETMWWSHQAKTWHKVSNGQLLSPLVSMVITTCFAIIGTPSRAFRWAESQRGWLSNSFSWLVVVATRFHEKLIFMVLESQEPVSGIVDGDAEMVQLPSDTWLKERRTWRVGQMAYSWHA